MTGMKLELSLFVEHGRERAAAEFYCSAFGAQKGECHFLDDGTVAGIDITLGGTRISVCGSNPNREAAPWRGGPFFPKAAGAVSTMFPLTVSDLDKAVVRAMRHGAELRDPVQPDTLGRRVASVFDPYGHIWALIESKTQTARQAA